MTRSTTEQIIGLEATSFVLRQMLSVPLEAVEVFGLSTAHILPTSTSGHLQLVLFLNTKYKFCDPAEPSGA